MTQKKQKQMEEEWWSSLEKREQKNPGTWVDHMLSGKNMFFHKDTKELSHIKVDGNSFKRITTFLLDYLRFSPFNVSGSNREIIIHALVPDSKFVSKESPGPGQKESPSSETEVNKMIKSCSASYSSETNKDLSDCIVQGTCLQSCKQQIIDKVWNRLALKHKYRNEMFVPVYKHVFHAHNRLVSLQGFLSEYTGCSQNLYVDRFPPVRCETDTGTIYKRYGILRFFRESNERCLAIVVIRSPSHQGVEDGLLVDALCNSVFFRLVEEMNQITNDQILKLQNYQWVFSGITAF